MAASGKEKKIVQVVRLFGFYFVANSFRLWSKFGFGPLLVQEYPPTQFYHTSFINLKFPVSMTQNVHIFHQKSGETPPNIKSCDNETLCRICIRLPIVNHGPAPTRTCCTATTTCCAKTESWRKLKTYDTPVNYILCCQPMFYDFDIFNTSTEPQHPFSLT